MNNEYYTPQEALKLLGMTYSGLQNQVNTGNLHPIIPPGRKQRVYPKKEVDTLKAELEAWSLSRQIARKAPPARFIKATTEDMPQAVALADAVFGGVNTIPLERRIEWLQKNPDLDHLLKQEDQIVGYFSLAPLRSATIDDLLHKRRLAKDLMTEDILTYVPGETVDLYGMAIGVRPGVSLEQKRKWGELLLLGARRMIVNLGQRGVVIRFLKTHSSTPDGINLMRHIGFTEVVSSIPGMHDFVIDMEQSGLPFVMDYKAALKTWRNLNTNGYDLPGG
ncbi:MAG: hypothetical protein H0W02_01940 [Ktedonobacteraceae bacterium]|nr:hypothetical protein [Ktedonobacteraceae bacterium]